MFGLTRVSAVPALVMRVAPVSSWAAQQAWVAVAPAVTTSISMMSSSHSND
jgi:hypothetical protein